MKNNTKNNAFTGKRVTFITQIIAITFSFFVMGCENKNLPTVIEAIKKNEVVHPAFPETAQTVLVAVSTRNIATVRTLNPSGDSKSGKPSDFDFYWGSYWGVEYDGQLMKSEWREYGNSYPLKLEGTWQIGDFVEVIHHFEEQKMSNGQVRRTTIGATVRSKNATRLDEKFQSAKGER